MRCCASRVVLFLAAAAPAVATAQAPAPADADLSAMIADAIAARWGVSAVNVALDWDADEAPADVRSFRLSGSGADGTWLVTIVGDTATKAFVVLAGIEGRERVAARDLERRVTLEPSDITLETAVRWGPPQRDELVAVPGWQTQRRIRAGEALRPPAVTPPLAVRSGEDVQIEMVRGMVSVTATARAAGSARIGEPVNVRLANGRRLGGIVVAPGRVRIGGTQEER